jgi:hypothetical protein
MATSATTELAPPGWHLYIAYAADSGARRFRPTEVELALWICANGFRTAQAKICRSASCATTGRPSTAAGYDLPRETGIDGLWCVGDAVKQYGNGGTQAVRDCENRHRCHPGAAASRAAAEPGLNEMPTTIPTQANINSVQAAPDPSCLLEFRNIRVVYDNAIEAIRDVSIAVPEGGIVALLGSNGAGKSTLLKAMSGILYTEEGVIETGTIASETRKHRPRARRTGSARHRAGARRPPGFRR